MQPLLDHAAQLVVGKAAAVAAETRALDASDVALHLGALRVAEPNQAAGAERGAAVESRRNRRRGQACGTRRGPAAAGGRGRGPARRSRATPAESPRPLRPRQRMAARQRPLAGVSVSTSPAPVPTMQTGSVRSTRSMSWYAWYFAAPPATLGAGNRNSMRRGGFTSEAAPNATVQRRSETAWIVSPQLCTSRTSVPSCGSIRVTGSCFPSASRSMRSSSSGANPLTVAVMSKSTSSLLARFRESSTSVRSTRWNGRGGIFRIGHRDHGFRRFGRDAHRAGQVEELETHLDAGNLVDARILGLHQDVGQHRFFPARALGRAGLHVARAEGHRLDVEEQRKCLADVQLQVVAAAFHVAHPADGHRRLRPLPGRVGYRRLVDQVLAEIGHAAHGLGMVYAEEDAELLVALDRAGAVHPRLQANLVEQLIVIAHLAVGLERKRTVAGDHQRAGQVAVLQVLVQRLLLVLHSGVDVPGELVDVDLRRVTGQGADHLADLAEARRSSGFERFKSPPVLTPSRLWNQARYTSIT